jgi:hypothetical protein
MSYYIEGATPKQERIITEWLDVLVDLLEMKQYGEPRLHVKIAYDMPKNAGALMRPFKLPDGTLAIELNAKHPDKALPGLAHEMVHALQVMRGDQVVPERGLSYWKGKPYNLGAVADRAMKDQKFYMSLPWEKEAHAKMYKLADQVAARTSAWHL